MFRTVNRKSFVLITLVTFIYTVFSFSLFSQTQLGNVMGFVYKKDGKKPVKDSVVILQNVDRDVDKKRYKSEPSGDSGDYRLYNLPSGLYKAAVKIKSGRMFYPLSVIRIDAGRTSIRSFYLVPKYLLGWIWPCGLAMVASGTAVILKLPPDKPKRPPEVSPTQR